MNVAVTGVGATAGLAIVRSLRQADLPLRLLGLDASAWAPALYLCDDAALVPRVSDEDRYLDVLEALIRKHRIEALVPGLDIELGALSRARDRFRSLGCCTIVSPPEVIRFARDKEVTYQVLRDKGIPFARTQTLDSFRRSCTPASFPAIVKPKDGAGSVGVTVLCGPADLERYRPRPDDIVQDYLIPAAWGLKTLTLADVMRGERLRQDDEVRLQTLIAPSGEIMPTFANVNVMVNGASMRICPTTDPALLDFAQRAFSTLAAMGAVGPCNLQGRITDAGLVLYEVNLRFTGCSAVRAAMGYNECEAALRLFVLGESPASVASRLIADTDAVCLRFLAETVVPRASIDRLASPRSRG
jgi:carbamoyl-phosphate synthase large subunit